MLRNANFRKACKGKVKFSGSRNSINDAVILFLGIQGNDRILK